MNWIAILKHVLSGFLTGFLSIAGAAAFIEDVNMTAWQMASTAGAVGALRALQEWLSPTSYIRPPNGSLTSSLSGRSGGREVNDLGRHKHHE